MKKVLGWVMAMMLAMHCGALAKPDAELIHMTFTCGSPMFTVNGVRKPLAEGDDSVAPYLQDDRLMVPLRAFAESFGMDVQWDAKKPDEIGLSIGELQIDLTIDATVAKRYGAADLSLDPPACRHDGRTYVPLRALCDWLSLEVTWDGNLQQAAIRELSDMELFEMIPLVSYENEFVEVGATMINHTDVDMYMPGRYAYYTLEVYDKTGKLVYPIPVDSESGLGEPPGGPAVHMIPANSQINDTIQFGWLQPGEYDAILKSDLMVSAYGYRDIRRLPEGGISFTFEVPEK